MNSCGSGTSERSMYIPIGSIFNWLEIIQVTAIPCRPQDDTSGTNQRRNVIKSWRDRISSVRMGHIRTLCLKNGWFIDFLGGVLPMQHHVREGYLPHFRHGIMFRISQEGNNIHKFRNICQILEDGRSHQTTTEDGVGMSCCYVPVSLAAHWFLPLSRFIMMRCGSCNQQVQIEEMSHLHGRCNRLFENGLRTYFPCWRDIGILWGDSRSFEEKRVLLF